MPIDLIIPFGILIALVVYLIYSRDKFEKNIVNIYEDKFENWKENISPTKNEDDDTKKEFVGLVYKENKRLCVEIFDEKYQTILEAKKFTIKVNR